MPETKMNPALFRLGQAILSLPPEYHERFVEPYAAVTDDYQVMVNAALQWKDATFQWRDVAQRGVNKIKEINQNVAEGHAKTSKRLEEFIANVTLNNQRLLFELHCVVDELKKYKAKYGPLED